MFDFLQIVLLSLSLIFFGYQLFLQRREVSNQVALQSYELYRSLVGQYTELLYRADRDTTLNTIWEPPDTNRMQELDAAQQTRRWGAWYAMTSEEKRCYRYVRYALETFEQTFQVYQRGWIDNETWQKWRGWMAIWRNVRYFNYVFDDTCPRLIESFVNEFHNLAVVPPTWEQFRPTARVSEVREVERDGES
jgi:hypothetical protein